MCNKIWKQKTIIIIALGMNEFFCVLRCSYTKEMWDTLQTTYEGATEVKWLEWTQWPWVLIFFKWNLKKIFRKWKHNLFFLIT